MQNESRMVAVVRAIPNPGHKRRWCGLERWVPDPEKRPQQEMEELATGGFRPKFDEDGRPIYAKQALPWPDTEIKVFVVDEPAPFDPNANGGAPVEISPATLAMLRKDPRINVQMLNGEGGDPREVIAMKGELAEAQAKLSAAERKIAGLHEQAKAAREEEKSKQAATISELRAEIAKLQGQLAEANTSPKKR